MRNLFKLSAFLLIFFTVSSSKIYSQSPNLDSPASPSADINPVEVEQKIKARIQQAVSTANGNSGSQKLRGWVGIIESLTADTLSLLIDNTTRLVALDQNTNIINAGSNINPQDLEVSSPVLTMGYVDNTDILTAKRIVTIDDLPQKPTKHTKILNFVSTNTQETIITLFDPIQRTQLELSISKKTNFYIHDSKEKLQIQDLPNGTQLLVIFETDEQDPESGSALTIVQTQTSPIIGEYEILETTE